MGSVFLFSLLIAGAQDTNRDDDDLLFPECDISSYYASMGSMSFSFDFDNGNWSRETIESLLLVTHRRVLPYTASDNTDEDADDVWNALIDLDAGPTSDFPNETVQLMYSDGVPVPAFPHGTASTWNREHVWPSSRGVGNNGATFTDVHHLRPADWNVNSARSNLYFGNCFSTDNVDMDCQSPAAPEAGSDTSKNSHIFTPPVSSRGDIARALFYMDVRYSSANNFGVDLKLTDCPTLDANVEEEIEKPEMAYLSILLQWHIDDPVDSMETNRNDRVCSRWQGNRNPFVDFPDLVKLIFDTTSNGSLNCTADLSPTHPYLPNDTNQPTLEPSLSPTTLRVTNNVSASFRMVQPGDVLIVGTQSDNPDWVALVALHPIPATTQLFLTDNAWIPTHSESPFLTNE